MEGNGEQKNPANAVKGSHAGGPKKWTVFEVFFLTIWMAPQCIHTYIYVYIYILSLHVFIYMR